MNKISTHQHLFDAYHLKMVNSIIEDLPPVSKGIDPKDEKFDKPISELK